MIAIGVLYLCSAAMLVDDGAQRVGSAMPPRAEAPEVLFYDRLHATFVLLNQLVYPAYLDHFEDDPASRSVLYHFDGRLASLRGDWRRALSSFHQSVALAPADAPLARRSAERIMADPRHAEVLAAADLERVHRLASHSDATVAPAPIESALAAATRRDAAALAEWLDKIGMHPAVVLKRSGHDSPSAPCPLYDPELILAHRILWELRTGAPAPANPDRVAERLADRHAALRRLREQPAGAELSLRKFLDAHRRHVWEIGWLFRCAGVELDQQGDPSAAHDRFLRAWAIGEALFPPSERGRLDRLDRVFLAELGDVYARLGRYDLMLRYMYSDDGLPAQFELARPISQLARAAESVRLTRAEQTAVELGDEVLPVTVSQILFEQPVSAARGAAQRAGSSAATRPSRLGWVLIGGGILLVACVVWRVWRVRAAKTGSNSKELTSVSSFD